MADNVDAVVPSSPCPECHGLRMVPRRYDSGPRETRGPRVRAAAIVACPSCVIAPKQLDEGNGDA